eukprot:92887-Rhodomonas_salina.1
MVEAVSVARNLVGKDITSRAGLRVNVTEQGRIWEVEKAKRGDTSQGSTGTIVEIREQGGICLVKWDVESEVVPYPTGVLGRFYLVLAADSPDRIPTPDPENENQQQLSQQDTLAASGVLSPSKRKKSTQPNNLTKKPKTAAQAPEREDERESHQDSQPARSASNATDPPISRASSSRPPLPPSTPRSSSAAQQAASSPSMLFSPGSPAPTKKKSIRIDIFNAFGMHRDVHQDPGTRRRLLFIRAAHFFCFSDTPHTLLSTPEQDDDGIGGPTT